MKTDLYDYVKVYNLLSKELCEKSISEMEDIAKFQQHNFTFYEDSEMIRRTRSGDKELSMSFDVIPSTPEIMQVYWNAIYTYFKELNFPWYTGWQGFTQVRFNRYQQSTLMALHCDHIKDLFDGNRKGIPVISIVGVFNDDYKGGDFIMFDDKKIDLKQGDVLLFPSNFLYPHEVTEVTEGCRYTGVSWVW